MAEHRWLVKHPEVEETIDLWFYRPLGYGVSRLLRESPLTPDHVSLAAALVGAVGGHLFLYGRPLLDLLGACALVSSALLDSVDGQLARLRRTSSPTGRMHDGLSDSIVFISVYVHLAGRLVLRGAHPLLLPFAVVLVASQFLANAMADVYRNSYLRYALCDAGAEGDWRSDLQAQSAAARAQRKGLLLRVLLFFYERVAAQQEGLNPQLTALRKELDTRRLDMELVSRSYRRLFRPLLPQLAWLGTNVRVFVLLLFLPFDAVGGFFWVNLTLMNAALVLFLRAHERRARTLLLALRDGTLGVAGAREP